jgi:hypothetical protein
MSNGHDDCWDILSGDEGEFVEDIMRQLRECAWARPLLDAIAGNGGLTRANKARFFELRLGFALQRAGVELAYEVAGEGQSTLDFGFQSGGQSWRVELMRLEETEAARRATWEETDEDGVHWFGRTLRSRAEDARQSDEGETLKAVERICQKCELNGRPHKFPVPEARRYHALLVDFRTFLNGGDAGDRLHVGLGGEYVRTAWHRRYWNGRLISGVFNERTTVRGAAEARARVHFLGFVNERGGGYREGGFAEATQFIANPYRFADVDAMRAAIDTWPLRPVQVLNGG